VGRILVLALVAVAVAVAACSGGVASTPAPAFRYAIFLTQMIEAREAILGSVEGLVSAGSGTGTGQTKEAIRETAEDLARIVDDQRAWLAENPPADCYAEAHAAAGLVADALSTASTAAIGWADAMDAPALADPGEAFAAFQVAARDLADEAESLGAVMEATSCLE
jgi:hypothetical protein